MNGNVDLEAAMQDIIDLHNAIYHPGYRCAENEMGECLDRFGGSPTSGPLGERVPIGYMPTWMNGAPR